jgi:hypothetical protein
LRCFITGLGVLGFRPSNRQTCVATKAFNLQAFRALHALQRFADIEYLIVVRHLQPRRTLKISLRQLRATSSRENQAAKIVNARVERALVDGFGQVLVRLIVVVIVERVDAAAIQLAQQRARRGKLRYRAAPQTEG